MDIKECTKGFSGLLVIADIHGDVESFRRAVLYAKNNSLLIVSLGDLVDRGPYPYETVDEVHTLILNNELVFVRGNHDNKHYRHAKGNQVLFSNDGLATMYSVGSSRMVDYLKKYATIYEHPHADYYHFIDNWMFVHGATHKTIWAYPDTLSSKAKTQALYGEITGKKDADHMPERVYTWVDEIPSGKCVIVGHDRKAIHGVCLREPLLVTSPVTGGIAIFADTGCGKDGVLSGVVLKFEDQMYGRATILDKYLQFTED